MTASATVDPVGLLTPQQIVKVVDHLRSLCTENAWPRGDLNLPRAMVTEKAFPENETVVTAAINARGTPGIASAAMYERRIGASAMFEIIVPFDFTNDGATWGSAFGDQAHIGYTGVDPAFRGRGLGYLVKQEMHRLAYDAGARTCATDNEEHNSGIRHVNEALGYAKVSGSYWMQRPI